MLNLPPLRAVQVFEAVGRLGSVTRAAEELGVSPGAVTQQVHALEKHLRVRLVQRCGRGIELTTWGALYLQRIAAGLEQLRKAQHEVDRARRSNHLAISAITSLSAKWLGPLLFAWNAQHRGATAILDADDAEPGVEAGDVDFRISYGARRRVYHRYMRLFTDYVIAVASPKLLAGGLPSHPRDLLKKPLVWTDWGPEFTVLPMWHEWFGAVGVPADRLRAGLTFNSSSAAVDAAIEGQGFALVQHSMAARALASKALVRIHAQALPLPEYYFLAWNSAALDKPIGAAFHAWLIDEARRFDFEPGPVGG
jgi:LysR family glycine cleavage system transcriptional activator